MNQDELIRMFKDSGALLDGHFKLSSGRHSDVYYEKFTLLKQPATCTLICQEMAARLEPYHADTIVGPTTGGIIIAYDVARYLGVQALYAEPGQDGRVFKRGFSLDRNQKVIIVDDVLTTGRSVREVVTLVESYGAEIVCICEMLERSNGTVSFDYPFIALASVRADSWEPDECPLCAHGMELTKRGSRKF